MSLQIYIPGEDIAAEFGREPAELFEVLALMADEAEGAWEDIAAHMAEAHSGSLAHEKVLPFLRCLADRLEALEGQYSAVGAAGTVS